MSIEQGHLIKERQLCGSNSPDQSDCRSNQKSDCDTRSMTAATLTRWRGEEPGLIKAWQERADSDAMTILLRRYNPLLRKLVREIIIGRAIPHIPRGDLDQEASLAFIKSVSDFKFDKGAQLSTYAAPNVRNALLRFVLDYKNVYRVGTSSDERKAFFAALTRRNEKIKQGEGGQLDPEDIEQIRKSTGASRKSVDRAINAVYSRSSSIEDSQELESLADIEENDDELSITKAMSVLEPFIAGLGERQKSILEAIMSDKDISNQQLADRYDITVERIGQIRRDMLSDMSIHLKRHGISAPDLF